MPRTHKNGRLCKNQNRAEFPASTKNTTMNCAGRVTVNVAKRAHDQCSIFSTVQ